MVAPHTLAPPRSIGACSSYLSAFGRPIQAVSRRVRIALPPLARLDLISLFLFLFCRESEGLFLRSITMSDFNFNVPISRRCALALGHAGTGLPCRSYTR